MGLAPFLQAGRMKKIAAKVEMNVQAENLLIANDQNGNTIIEKIYRNPGIS